MMELSLVQTQLPPSARDGGRTRRTLLGPRSCYEYLAQQGALAASDFGMFGNEKTVATRSRPETPDADQGALTGRPMPSHGEAHCCDPGRQIGAMKEEAEL